MDKISESFGKMVFSEAVMKQRLPKEAYDVLLNTTKAGHHLNPAVADVVANAMKDWAIEKGATHYTHWFQPLTGITAEKHDAFIKPAEDGKVIMEFSGKELIQGEPDASSFPSGGLRSTFEARGYTAWDPTSYAFIKDGVLCIPTAFCSYSGDSLDQKTPLLKSMEALNRQTMRILRLFGNEDVSRIITNVGPEQEYFLIDQNMYEKRPDLVYTGRTLLGAKPSKGQELDDHYFGTIKPRVLSFMKDVDKELWKLGVYAKTEHNEVAPGQHELAQIYTMANLACDQNQLVMEIMQKVAHRHGMVCLLAEKPFEGVNGSGKHNNWSISTDTGINLLEPGDTPYENAQFLLLLCAVIQAVDTYQDLLRISVASANNDHRLGANEAPPAIISMFLGTEITGILEAIEKDIPYDAKDKEQLKIGVHVLPRFSKDTTDRNRTSPFAFTGNKFEFRSVGSSQSISQANVIINSMVADVLEKFADELESADDFEIALHELIKRTITEHKRIIFNGNGYEEAWVIEAERRGLLNLRTTPDALPYLLDKKNVDMFARQRVFTESELRSRFDIMMDNYSKVINIEALTMIDMVKRSILPCVSAFQSEVAETIVSKRAVSKDLKCFYEEKLLGKLSDLTDTAFSRLRVLEENVETASKISGVIEVAVYYKDNIVTAMYSLREAIDELESITDSSVWPYPSYGDILYSVK